MGPEKVKLVLACEILDPSLSVLVATWQLCRAISCKGYSCRRNDSQRMKIFLLTDGEATSSRAEPEFKVKWENPFFDSSISPKKSKVEGLSPESQCIAEAVMTQMQAHSLTLSKTLQDTQFKAAAVPLDDNPAYDSCRGETGHRRQQAAPAVKPPTEHEVSH